MIQNLSRLPRGGSLCYGCSLSVLAVVSEILICLSTLSIASPFGSLLSWEQHAPRAGHGQLRFYFFSPLSPSSSPVPRASPPFYLEFSALQPLSDVGGERVLPVLDPVPDREAPASSSVSPLFINLSRCLGRKGQSNNWGLNSPCPAQKGPESVCFLSLLSLCQTVFGWQP